jgi:hypothetical protein
MTIFRRLSQSFRVLVPRYRKMQQSEDASGQIRPSQVADWREGRSARGRRHLGPAAARRAFVVMYVEHAKHTAKTIERVAPATESEMPQPVKSAT